MAERVCNECVNKSSFVDGQLVCTACGLVQDNIIVGTDVPLCSNQQTESFSDFVLPPYSQTIVRNIHEELLINICSNQNIPRSFANEAYTLFKEKQTKTGFVMKEKSLTNLLIACLYATLKKKNSSYTLIELRAYADFEPKKVLTYYNQYLHDPYVVLLPSNIVFRLCSRLALSRQDSTSIQDLTKKWENENNHANKPETVVAGMICHYFLCNGLKDVHGFSFKSISHICKLCFVNPNTVRRFLNKYHLLPK